MKYIDKNPNAKRKDRKKLTQETKYVQIADGLFLGESFSDAKENRLLTLMFKGIIVYMLTMGAIGCYLSAFEIEYNAFLCHIVILAGAFFCAGLYYRLFTENLGYFALFVTFALMVFQFRIYINSGYYEIINLTVSKASEYFSLDIEKVYDVQIDNPYVTVTYFVLFLGIVLDILINVFVSRRMQYVVVALIVIPLNLIPIYFNYEPDAIYSFMLLLGLTLTVVYKNSRHYAQMVSFERTNDSFEFRKREIFYKHNVKGYAWAAAPVVAVTLAVCIVVQSVWPKDSFQTGHEVNKYKKLSEAAVATMLMDGIGGLFDRSRDNGGLMGGSLGEVSSVRLDNKTDLVVVLAPSDDKTIYLKNFQGVIYNPYKNYWTNSSEIISDLSKSNSTLVKKENVLNKPKTEYDGFVRLGNDYVEYSAGEVDGYERYYIEGGKNSSVSKMLVVGVDDMKGATFYPYYAKYSQVIPRKGNNEVFEDIEDALDINRQQSNIQYYNMVVYYPEMEESRNIVLESDYLDYDLNACYDFDLNVPNDNKGAIREFIETYGIGGTDEEIIGQLQDIFQRDYKYTVRPGKTPKKEDFVNNFLIDKKKGYCSYYASSAVLVLRYLGIPARYSEGYAISFNDILTFGEIVEGKLSYNDFHQGYSALGETAPVALNVTDASAHAWVEVYFEGRGWVPVEFTPFAEDEEEVEDFWEMFDDIYNTGDGDTADVGDGAGAIDFKVPMELIKNIIRVFVGVVILILLIILFLFGKKILMRFVRYCKADINDRLIYKYQSFLRRYGRRHKELRTKKNYTDQLDYLYSRERDGRASAVLDREDALLILERAGFSNKLISREESDNLLAVIKRSNFL